MVRALVVTLALAVPISLIAASPAGAAVEAWATWTVAGGSGTMSTPEPTFPTATFTTNATNPTTPTGASTWLNANTPIGAIYGSSQNQRYLSLNTAAGQTPSTTTLTFSSATPASGWSFALGDIDADSMTITGTTTGGVPLTAAQLGFQSTFNFCGSSPKPSSCPSGFQTDVPTWNAGTQTLTGSGTDTSGAAGWFSPTVPVTSLTFVFTRIIGIPVGFLWLVALTDVPVTTTTEATTTTTTTTTTPPTTATPTDDTSEAAADVDGSTAAGSIAATGDASAALALVGTALTVVGGACVGTARRLGRRRSRS